MKIRRRDLLESSGAAGLSIAGCCFLKGFASESEHLDRPGLDQLSSHYEKSHVQRYNMSGYAASRLDTVRIGIIGLGQRGPAHMRTMRRRGTVGLSGQARGRHISPNRWDCHRTAILETLTGDRRVTFGDPDIVYSCGGSNGWPGH